MIPSAGEAVALHRKYGSSETVVEHCRTVATAAQVLVDAFRSRGLEVDEKAVAAGAMLHDIGRSKVQTFRHGLEGAEIVQREGVDKEVVEIVRRHVGAGISPGEAKSLGLPPFDYIPRTVEERIVCFADKMVDSTRVRPFEKEVQRFVAKGHDVDRLRALKRNLEEELDEDPETLVLEKLKATP